MKIVSNIFNDKIVANFQTHKENKDKNEAALKEAGDDK